MFIPDFTENSDDKMILYFNVSGKNAADVQNELEKTYVCFSKMSVVTKDGTKYVALEIDNEE